MTDADVVSRLKLFLLAREVKTANKRAGQVLWYVVSQMLGCGCTTATEWCMAQGLNPCLRVKVKV